MKSLSVWRKWAPRKKKSLILLVGSSIMYLCFNGPGLKLQGYVDVDLSGDIYSWKSTIGFVYTQVVLLCLGV